MLFTPFTDERIAAAKRDVLRIGGVNGSSLVARLERITGPVDLNP